MEKLNSFKVQKKLREKEVSVFSPLDFQRIFGVSYFAAKNFINRHTTTGLFTKIRNGLYVVTDAKPPNFILANKIYEPSYISFETALSYYNIIPETIYTVFSATVKPTREFDAMDISYVYHRIKKQLFFAYTARKQGGMTFLVAEPAKALVDFLYFVDLRKKDMLERIDTREVKKKDAIGVAKYYNRSSVVKRITELYDKQKTH
ncbi:hypothetical protein IBX73_08620 [candidate division WOR-3 bacterium]|nr:hypothetical protein [candidate division WOR-3 bacterium]